MKLGIISRGTLLGIMLIASPLKGGIWDWPITQKVTAFIGWLMPFKSRLNKCQKQLKITENNRDLIALQLKECQERLGKTENDRDQKKKRMVQLIWKVVFGTMQQGILEKRLARVYEQLTSHTLKLEDLKRLLALEKASATYFKDENTRLNSFVSIIEHFGPSEEQTNSSLEEQQQILDKRAALLCEEKKKLAKEREQFEKEKEESENEKIRALGLLAQIKSIHSPTENNKLLVEKLQESGLLVVGLKIANIRLNRRLRTAEKYMPLESQ